MAIRFHGVPAERVHGAVRCILQAAPLEDAMTYMDPNDPNRLPNDYSARPSLRDSGGMAIWGFPLIMIAALVMVGFILFGTGDHRWTTASNDTSAPNAQKVPAPSPQRPPAK